MQTRPTIQRFSGVLLLALLLGGCGFHLRGAGGESSFPQVESAYLQGINPYSSFGRMVTEMFEGDGVLLVSNPAIASVTVMLEEPVARRDILSLDRSVHAREYSLVTQLKYTIQQKGHISPSQVHTLSVRRDLVIDPNDLLGSDYEANRLRDEMYREVIQTLLFRLRMMGREG